MGDVTAVRGHVSSRAFGDVIEVEDEPFWISPHEAEKALRSGKRVYQQTYPEAPADSS